MLPMMEIVEKVFNRLELGSDRDSNKLGALKVNRDVFRLIHLFDSGKIAGYMATRERVGRVKGR